MAASQSCLSADAQAGAESHLGLGMVGFRALMLRPGRVGRCVYRYCPPGRDVVQYDKKTYVHTDSEPGIVAVRGEVLLLRDDR